MAAAAEISLGNLRAPGTREFLTKQLARDSRWWDSVRLGALIGLGKLQDPALASAFENYAAPAYNQDVWDPVFALAAGMLSQQMSRRPIR